MPLMQMMPHMGTVLNLCTASCRANHTSQWSPRQVSPPNIWLKIYSLATQYYDFSLCLSRFSVAECLKQRSHADITCYCTFTFEKIRNYKWNKLLGNVFYIKINVVLTLTNNSKTFARKKFYLINVVKKEHDKPCGVFVFCR